jgi:hypothetical protein
MNEDNNKTSAIKNKELFYTYNANEGFVSKVEEHGAYNANGILMEQMWSAYEERVAEARAAFKEGTKSPVLYHMERTHMDIITLSVYMGFRPGRIKRHFIPSVYKRLSKKILNKYAVVFELQPEELEQID